MRISDADRHRVAEVLREAAGEGRLDLDELDERLELTFAAKTYADLVPITADLHAARPAPRPTARRCRARAAYRPWATRPRSRSWASASGAGVWQVPGHHAAFALMGSITLDLRRGGARRPARPPSTPARSWATSRSWSRRTCTSSSTGTPIMGDYGQGKDKVPADLGPGLADRPGARAWP